MYRLADNPLTLTETQNALLGRALDPADSGVTVVAWPGRHIAAPLQNGDIIVRQPLSGPVRSFTLTGEVNENGYAIGEATDSGTAAFGGPTDVRFRLHGADRMLRDDLTIVRVARPLAERDYGETPPMPPASRPTIRQGSRGPAVNEAQQRLNSINSRRLAGGQSRIDRCPLVVDGIFGPNSRGATVSFQRLAFAAQPNEWDGVIGPKTWAQLDAWSYEQPVDPPTPVSPPPPPSINPPNIIPIIFRPPNPVRWGPLLGGLAYASIRNQNAVHSLIDGPATYRSMLADLRRANNPRSFIYLLGWDCHDNFPLNPKPPSPSIPCSTSLNQVLNNAVAAGAQVRAMIWKNLGELKMVGQVAVRINALKSATGNGACIIDSRNGGSSKVKPETVRDMLTAMTKALFPLTQIPGVGDEVQRLNTKLALYLDKAVREMLAAHHQKVLVIFDGERLVAYCGGIDFNPNRALVTTNCIPGSATQKINPSDPQHDTHCRIIGPAASDLLATFVDRWLDHPDHVKIDGTSGVLRGAKVSSIPSPPVPNPSSVDAPAGGPTSVIIARTYNPPHGGAIPRQRDIRTLLLRAIDKAESFIYFEDQYLWDFDTPSTGPMSIATALNRALPSLKHITAVIPANAISGGWPLGQFQRAWRQKFIDEVRRGHRDEIADRFQVYQRNFGPCTDDGCLGGHTYVHSKCWVFDDELAVIGSANCNRRGYQHDSEVDAFIWDEVAPVPPMIAMGNVPNIPGIPGFDPRRVLASFANVGDQASEQVRSKLTFAQDFRVRLWFGHLGKMVFDGADNSDWPKGTTVVGDVVRFKTNRPPIISTTVDPIVFPIVAKIAESFRPIVDPVSP